MAVSLETLSAGLITLVLLYVSQSSLSRQSQSVSGQQLLIPLFPLGIGF